MIVVDYLRLVTLAVFAASFILWGLLWRHLTWQVIAPLSYCLHVIIFYLVRLTTGLHLLNAEGFNLWSAAIRLHAGMLILGAAIILLRERKP